MFALPVEVLTQRNSLLHNKKGRSAYSPNGLRPVNRGDRRWTFLNDREGIGLFRLAIAQSFAFAGDAFSALAAADAEA
jgi:hypothetical protein